MIPDSFELKTFIKSYDRVLYLKDYFADGTSAPQPLAIPRYQWTYNQVTCQQSNVENENQSIDSIITEKVASTTAVVQDERLRWIYRNKVLVWSHFSRW